MTALLVSLQLLQHKPFEQHLATRRLRPLLFVEPRLQYLLPLPPFSLIRCAIGLCIPLLGLMRLCPYSNTSNDQLATTTFSSRNHRSLLLASPPVNRQGRTYDLRRV